jgi:hypothetical protein
MSGRDEGTRRDRPPVAPERSKDEEAKERGTVEFSAHRAPLCDLCGTPMRESHCKLVCGQCGYTRDCSDP